MNSFTKYTDARQWLRGLVKTSVHSGTSVILAGFGSNGIEGLTPEKYASLTKGIGLSLRQLAVVFFVSCLLGAIKFINDTTNDTNQPFPPVTPPPTP